MSELFKYGTEDWEVGVTGNYVHGGAWDDDAIEHFSNRCKCV